MELDLTAAIEAGKAVARKSVFEHSEGMPMARDVFQAAMWAEAAVRAAAPLIEAAVTLANSQLWSLREAIRNELRAELVNEEAG